MNEEKLQNDITVLSIRIDEIHNMVQSLLGKTPQQTTIQQSVEPKKQYPATCHVCGCNCTVPFKPGANSNIKCLSCYRELKEKQNGGQ